MAKAVKKKIEYTKISPLERKMLNPYTAKYVAPGEEMVVDSGRATFHIAMGEAELIEENVVSPHEVAGPVTASTIGGQGEEVKTETKLETKAKPAV